MNEYIWELGINWNAVETAGTPPESYLRGCLSLGRVPLPGTVMAHQGDTIIFRIFDVTPSGTSGVGSIESLEILSTAAVKSQAEAQVHHGLGLELSQPTIPLVITQIPPDQPPKTSSAFGPAQASWTAPRVYVTATEGRFLLTPQVLAAGVDDALRLFSSDPEMVVGPNT